MAPIETTRRAERAPGRPASRLRTLRMASQTALVLALTIFTGAGAAARDSVEARIDALLASMTLEEKVGQLNLNSHGSTLTWDQLPTGRIGALINFNNAQDIARAQKLARQQRLGIPFLFGLDILHGFRTIFPVPLGETATFSPSLARLAAQSAAREAAHVGVQWTYAPMADLSRDARWGRIVEGSGEDPYLGQVFAAARVEGFHAGGLATAAKHFAGYGAATGGRDYDATLIPPAELRDAYLPPFRAAIAAGSESIMSSFNTLNGVPSTANPWLLTGVLKREWGFRGFVVSDWAGIHELLAHGVAKDEAEATRKAFLAGVDMDMLSGFYDRHLAAEVQAGRVPTARLNDAVRRVLRVKLQLGLFERPDIDPTHTDAGFPTHESRQTARLVARESIVLLQNRGEALPLQPSIRSIALVGPLADARFDLLGPHAARGHAEDTTTIVDALTRRAGEAGAKVTHVAGCDLLCRDTSGFGAAVEAARAADAVVAIVGEPRDLSGEAASRAHLALSGEQRRLVEALSATGKPVILVLVAGRPLELAQLTDKVSSILMAWYPGTEGGTAIADILFGDANPSGKLPVTWSRSVRQLPMAYNRLPTGRPPHPENRFTLGYVDEALEPLFPFGFGLSYTGFSYRDLAILKPQLAAGDSVEARVTITNTGARPGQEAAQLYVRQPVASRSRPLRELKAFEKVALAPGESKEVTLRVPVRELGFHLDDGTYVVEPGRFQVWVGGSSLADLGTSFEVTEGVQSVPRQ